MIALSRNVTSSHSAALAEASIANTSIVAAWLRGKSPDTIRAYRSDLQRFVGHVEASGVASIDAFFALSAPQAHTLTLAYRATLVEAHQAPATINRQLATLRSLSKLARMLGRCAWVLEVPGVPRERRRQTAGPGMEVVRSMLAATAGDTERQTRDAAILWVFVCLGLRVSELCGLRLEQTDLARGTTWIRGKARREREQVPLPAPAVAAIRRYLRLRGQEPGPLFRCQGRRGAAADGTMQPRAVLKVIAALGRSAGHHVWCHGLRHTSITEAVDAGQRQGIGLDKIRSHSRHRSIATLMVYVDERDRSATQRALADLIATSIAV